MKKIMHDSYVYVKVCEGLYDLPQEGIIAQELLGYSQSKIIPGFWMHKWHPISLSLVVVVDDFSIKYMPTIS